MLAGRRERKERGGKATKGYEVENKVFMRDTGRHRKPVYGSEERSEREEREIILEAEFWI